MFWKDSSQQNLTPRQSFVFEIRCVFLKQREDYIGKFSVTLLLEFQ